MSTDPTTTPTMPTPEREGWYRVRRYSGRRWSIARLTEGGAVHMLWNGRDEWMTPEDIYEWGPNIDDALARLAAYESENARLREQLVADDEAGREAILAAMRITPEQTLAVYQGMGKVPCAHCGELVEYPSATHWRSCEKHPARQEFLRLLEEVGRNEVFAGLADEERRSKECPPGFADCEESGYCTLSMMAAINVTCALGLGDQPPLRKMSYVRAWEWVNTTLRLHRAAYDAAATSGPKRDEGSPAPGWAWCCTREHSCRYLVNIDGPVKNNGSRRVADTTAETWAIHDADDGPRLRAEVERLTAKLRWAERGEQHALGLMDAMSARVGVAESRLASERAATERDIAAHFGKPGSIGERIAQLILASDYPKADPQAAAPRSEEPTRDEGPTINSADPDVANVAAALADAACAGGLSGNYYRAADYALRRLAKGTP
jgi:hypothetical protein